MTDVIKYLIIAVSGYLLGSISCGVIVAKLYADTDIRQHGSGNTGMTNVMRTIGWVPGALTFAGDMLKGLLGALIGKLLMGNVGLQIGGACAIIGHTWPLFFRFKGGKGISTGFGYIIMADWPVAIALVFIQAAVLFITGYMSLASIISAFVFMICSMLSGNDALAIGGMLMSALVIYSHRENIKRLAKGHESKLDPVKITNISRKMVEKLKNRRKSK